MISDERLEAFSSELKAAIGSYLKDSTRSITVKGDASPVTDFDLFVSHFTKKFFESAQLNFLSEEDLHHLAFPGIVIDPLDGTREFIKNIPECAVSIAWMNSDRLNDESSHAFIFNPFTKWEAATWKKTEIKKRSSEKLLGLVSRSEYEAGLYKDVSNDNVEIKPTGSIAYKLALLSRGECDFVVTRKPKHIWDIAAGAILCKQQGLKMYCLNGEEVVSLDSLKLEPTLLWCSPKIASLLFLILCE